MKKVLIILSSILFSIILTELVVDKIIKYPKHLPNKKYVLCPEYTMFSFATLHSPYYSFWNVEGGNNVYHKNNLGLPGSDVDSCGNFPNIMILGDSYLEAESIPNDLVSTSYLASYLKLNYKRFNVINVGCASFDPYSLWFRLKLFEKYYNSSYVILVLEGFYEGNLALYKRPLDFTLQKDFGNEIPESGLVKYASIARINSSFLNLIFRSFAQKKTDEEKEKSIGKMREYSATNKDKEDILPESLIQCISKYRDDYGKKFILLGICENKNMNSTLSEYCKTNNINFVYSNKVLLPENRFDGKGHLNIEGNKLLGELIIEAFKKYIQQ